METKRKKRLGLILILCGISLIIIINFSISSNKIKKIRQEIEIESFDCSISSDKDTHGGFLGDGDYFAKLSCSKLNYDNLSNNWKLLPLTDSLNQIMNMKQCRDGGCRDVYEKYSIPNIQNGYYYFVDRHSDSNDKYDDSIINNRSSYNFTLALLDKDVNIIYYYRLDT